MVNVGKEVVNVVKSGQSGKCGQKVAKSGKCGQKVVNVVKSGKE